LLNALSGTLWAFVVNAVISTVALHPAHGVKCPKTFTVPMIIRAINATYRGTKDVTAIEKRRLRRYIACARNPKKRHSMDRYWNNTRNAWWRRVHPPLYTQLASWYYDAGGTACGFHAYLGVANKTLPCGTKVRFSYHGRSASAVVQDRGPYVGGRVWDLNQGLAGALGFSGVDYVQASVEG
jgi:rare lipoprotein A (peptidoglycan hydrolase)